MRSSESSSLTPPSGSPESEVDGIGTSLGLSNGDSGETLPSEASNPHRGISLKTAVRGTLTRFLPSSVLSLGIGLLFMEIPVGAEILDFLGTLLLISGAMTIGYGVGLESLRRWLFEDANVAGRRSVLAGLLSPLALFIAAVFSGGLGLIGSFFAFLIVGLAMGTVMFFPWLTPTDAHDHPANDNLGNSPDQSLFPADGTTQET